MHELRTWFVALLVLLALLSASRPAVALTSDEINLRESYAIDNLWPEGLDRTAPETITELLPRALPANLTGAEIIELRRRVKNLALFDRVDVELQPIPRTSTPPRFNLIVKVRRKLTIAPIFDLSTGKTFKDSKLTLGLVEHDIDGHASRLGGKASYSERGLNFVVWLYQHPYRPRSWAREHEVYYAGSGFRFEDSQQTWQRNRFGAELEFLSPSLYSTKWRYEFQLNAYQETLTIARGGLQPRDGTYLGTTSELVYDRYTWNDLTPKGFRSSLELRPGIFVGPAEPRHEARLKAIAGLPLAKRTVIMLNTNLNIVNAGNPNHSTLVGSQAGVRGLPDSLYRNRAHAYANLELRQAIEIADRWYIQGVLFTDAAVFEPMNARGHTTLDGPLSAWSTGVGLRLLPTALVDTLLRLDGSRLWFPESHRTWFLQFGISQYF